MKISAETFCRMFVKGVVGESYFDYAIQQFRMAGGDLSGNWYINSNIGLGVGVEKLFFHEYASEEAEAWLYQYFPGRILEDVYVSPKGHLRLIFDKDYYLISNLNRSNLGSVGCWRLSCDQLGGYISFDRKKGYTFREKPLLFAENQWWIDPVPDDLLVFLEEHQKAGLLQPSTADSLEC